METINVNAICLKTYPYSETSKIAVYWTREQGECRAIIKGVRKANSPLANASQVLTQMVLTLRPGNNLSQVVQVSSINSFPGIRKQLLGISAASMLAEWLMCNIHDPQADVLFDWLLSALVLLDKGHYDSPVIIRMAGEKQAEFMAITGHPLNLTHCLQCDSSLLHIDTVVYFAAAWGGAICQPCVQRERPNIGLVGMSPTTLKVLNQPNNETWQAVNGIKLQRFWCFLARHWWQNPMLAHEFWLQQLESYKNEQVLN